MNRGFYTAASGMYTQQRNINVFGNNMANVGTSGYKKDRLVTTTFQQELVMRLEKDNPQNFGKFDIIRHPEFLQTEFDQGNIEPTQRPYDMAILGEGFFVVKNADGEELLTRNGQFDVDDDGFLILRDVGKVQSTKGDIKLADSDFTVSKLGEITVGDKKGGTLKIVKPENIETLSNIAHGMMRDSKPDAWKQVKENIAVVSGCYERSNVDVTDEMTRIIAAQRMFQSCSQAVKMIDTTEAKLMEKIGSGV
ncbi:MAG: flagellar hook-basal body protein [Oscillospiraceae bacterium]